MEQVNSGVTDDGHQTPESFKSAFDDKYLGSPAVVDVLLANYCSFVHDGLSSLQSGSITKEKFVEGVTDAGQKLADIFHGRDSQYRSMVGWNSISLPARVQVYLKGYWHEHRAEFGDDPLRVFFSWLCWTVFDAMKRTDDPDLFGIIMSNHLKVAKDLLLGVDSRQ